MTEDRWEETKEMAKKNFEVVEEKTEPLYLKTGLTEDTKKEIGKKEVLIFTGPIGKIKLEYSIKPVVLEKKEHFSRRAGTSAQSEYILSETEFSRRLDAYKWSEADNDWLAIEATSIT